MTGGGPETYALPARYTVAEYLANEEQSPSKHEFVDGIVYAMSGASSGHNLLADFLYSRIDAGLTPPCEAFFVDMRLKIDVRAKTLFYYPDVLVNCSPDDTASHHREKPVLLIEVLSPTTERIDRTEKLEAYQRIPSLQEYALVASEFPKLEILRRAGGWAVETYGLGDTVTFESVGVTVELGKLYARIGF